MGSPVGYDGEEVALDPCPGVSARAVELLLAGVAVILLGTTAKHAAEGTDERWTLEPPRDGP